MMWYIWSYYTVCVCHLKLKPSSLLPLSPGLLPWLQQWENTTHPTTATSQEWPPSTCHLLLHHSSQITNHTDKKQAEEEERSGATIQRQWCEQARFWDVTVICWELAIFSPFLSPPPNLPLFPPFPPLIPFLPPLHLYLSSHPSFLPPSLPFFFNFIYFFFFIVCATCTHVWGPGDIGSDFTCLTITWLTMSPQLG